MAYAEQEALTSRNLDEIEKLKGEGLDLKTQIDEQKEKSAAVRIQLNALVQTLTVAKNDPAPHKVMTTMTCAVLREIMTTLPLVKKSWSEATKQE